MLGILKSINTSLYLIAISIIVFLAGSIYIPNNLDVFSEINDFPLFHWLYENRDFIEKTYWIHVQIVFMAALCLNMVVCTLDGIIGKLSAKNLIQKLSPHIMHIGILLVLFGHLVSGGFGYKKDIPVHEGEDVSIEDMTIHVDRVNLVRIEGENQRRWKVKISVSDDNAIMNSILEPASPAFLKGIGIFAKSAEENGRVLLRIVRDPGVKWEITGAVFFVIGALGIFWSRYIKIQV